AAAPKKSVPFLQERLSRKKKAVAIDPKRLARLIADLDDEEFKVREKAAAELAKLGKAAEPALQKALKETKSSEVGLQLRQLLKQLEGLPSETVRAVRAVEILERMGGPEARKALGTLAREATEPRLKEEAKASSQRLGKRSANKS